jgi:hypothetical protein
MLSEEISRLMIRIMDSPEITGGTEVSVMAGLMGAGAGARL